MLRGKGEEVEDKGEGNESGKIFTWKFVSRVSLDVESLGGASPDYGAAPRSLCASVPRLLESFKLFFLCFTPHQRPCVALSSPPSS